MTFTTEYQENLDVAINRAIDECIENNILKDILVAQRSEVLGVLLTTFNKELYEQGLKDDAEANGAKKKLTEQIQKKLAKGKSIETIADELEETPETIQNIMDKL